MRVSTRNSRKHFVSIHSMSVFILSEQSIIFLLFAAPFHPSDRFLQVWNIFSVLLFRVTADLQPSVLNQESAVRLDSFFCIS